MKVFLTIWILAVLIQEVVPSTLVRLPRNAVKNLSLVHTEYEAKYEQKGKHGNESFSTVSGKQEIVHDNCAENWNTFAEKCASLIKDLVASLANAVSSKPGDATNLQLHIKNTFKHFDNTHNCTCFNHTGKSLSDLDLSPLFGNITIKTVGPALKNSSENPSKNKNIKCEGIGQHCDGPQGSDSKSNKNVGVINSESNDPKSDKNESGPKIVKKCGQSNDESCDGNDDTFQKPLLPEHQKQLNRALVDAEDLDMNPENVEGLNDDQSTNNSRRQIKYPPNLEKPRKISRNPDYNSFSADSNPTQPENTKNVHHPFLVTPRPVSQSAKPSEPPTAALNPSSLSEPPMETESPAGSPAKSKGEPSSASSVLASPANGNTSPLNNYMHPAPQYVTEPQSSHNKEKDPNGEIFALSEPGMHQRPIPATGIKSPAKSPTNRNSQPPVVQMGKPVTEPYKSEPGFSKPPKAIFRKPNLGAGDEVIDSQNSGALKSPQSSHVRPNTHPPVIFPEDQIIDNYKSTPQELINDKQNEQPTVIFPKQPITDKQTPSPVFIPEQFQNRQNSIPPMPKPPQSIHNLPNVQSVPEGQLIDRLSSNPTTEMPVQSIGKEPNLQPTVMLPGNPPSDSPALNPVFIPEKAKNDQNSVPFVVNPEKLSEEPIVVLPEKPSFPNSNSAKAGSQPIISLPEESETKDIASDPSTIIPAVPVEKISEEQPNNQLLNTRDNQNSTSPVFVRYEKPIEDLQPEQKSLPTIKDDYSAQPQEDPVFTLNNDPIEQKQPFPVTNFNSNPPESSEPINTEEIINPSPLDQSFASGPASDPSFKPTLDKNPEILSPTDILSIPTADQIVPEQDTTTPAPTAAAFPQVENDLNQTTPIIQPIPTAPEIENQPSGDSTPIEEYLLPVTPAPGESPQKIQESIVNPQKVQNIQEITPTEEIQSDSKQPIQKLTFSTPPPIYPENSVPEIPENQVKTDQTTAENDPEEREIVATDAPFFFKILRDQKQPDLGILADETQNEQSNAPIIAPEGTGTTPVVFYPEKSLPIEEPLTQGNDNPEYRNIENRQPFTEEVFATPAPIPTLKPMQQQNSDATNPAHSIKTGEDNKLPDPADVQQEDFVPFLPKKELSHELYPQVSDQSDKVVEKSARPNSDNLSQGNDFSSVSPAPGSLDTAPKAIPPEPQPETAMLPPVLKPSQPGVLVSTTEPQPPQQEEEQSLLIHPTTFQTTSEEPTPSQNFGPSEPSSLFHSTTSIPQDSDETIPAKPSTSPKTPGIHEHDDDDEEDCCSCESCTEEEITDPKLYRENACKNLEEARRELKAIFDKIKKKLKCGKKAPQTITSS